MNPRHSWQHACFILVFNQNIRQLTKQEPQPNRSYKCIYKTYQRIFGGRIRLDTMKSPSVTCTHHHSIYLLQIRGLLHSFLHLQNIVSSTFGEDKAATHLNLSCVYLVRIAVKGQSLLFSCRSCKVTTVAFKSDAL